MRRGRDANAVLAVVMVVAIALVVSSLTRALALPNTRFLGGENNVIYLRLNAFSVTYQAVALGALAYVIAGSRLTVVALRFAALLGSIGVVVEVLEWITEPANSFGIGQNDRAGRAIAHLVEIATCGAVLLWWYLGERNRAPQSNL